MSASAGHTYTYTDAQQLRTKSGTSGTWSYDAVGDERVIRWSGREWRAGWSYYDRKITW